MDILLVEPAYKNKYPPMSLMKISTYHKNRGDRVYFVKGIEDLHKKWDRIYITTLFTFHYSAVIKTILHYKKYIDNHDNIWVGGILASLLTDDLKKDTKLKNIIKGRLFDSSLLGFEDRVNIDILPLDYDILYECNYIYPAGDNFFSYTTRGCVNRCSFCAVPDMEGSLKITNNIVKQIRDARECFGDKRNLLLMDNNILGISSNELQKIVEDLNDLGFVKEENFYYPSKFLKLFDAYYRYSDQNKSTQVIDGKIVQLFDQLMNKKISAKHMEQINEITQNVGKLYLNKVQMILDNVEFFIGVEKKYSYKKSMQRYVDFNQGMDARLLNEEKMKILSALPIRPFRIAYDKVKYTPIYQKAIRLAANYDVQEFSNYLLYNCEDHPIDLYDRLKININLSEELNVHIYSFPMKFEPINNKKRDHVDKNWNRHYLRSIKAILNVSKGVFSGDKKFFERAFGSNENEFFEILSMPKDILTYRFYYEDIGITPKWKYAFNNLSQGEKLNLINLISNDIFTSNNRSIDHVLQFYRINSLNKKNDIISIAI